MYSKIDKFGRVSIPKKLLRKLGLKPGETVILETSGREITIKPSFQENDIFEKLKAFNNLLAYFSTVHFLNFDV